MLYNVNDERDDEGVTILRSIASEYDADRNLPKRKDPFCIDVIDTKLTGAKYINTVPGLLDWSQYLLVENYVEIEQTIIVQNRSEDILEITFFVGQTHEPTRASQMTKIGDLCTNKIDVLSGVDYSIEEAIADREAGVYDIHNDSQEGQRTFKNNS